MHIVEKTGHFGGGDHQQVPCTVKIINLELPPGHHMIGGVLYRMTSDPAELGKIVYPDGSRPTACALVPVTGQGERRREL